MIIVDGTRTILHWGRIDEYIETNRLDLTLAGYDPVAIDAVSAKILGINPNLSVSSYGLSGMDLEPQISAESNWRHHKIERMNRRISKQLNVSPSLPILNSSLLGSPSIPQRQEPPYIQKRRLPPPVCTVGLAHLQLRIFPQHSSSSHHE